MALTDQQQNLISEMMNWAEIELSQLDKARALIKRFDLNDMFNEIVANDVPLIFPHLDKGEVVSGINALKAQRDALEEDIPAVGIPEDILLKLKG
jgi:hypothetical protein